MVPPAATGESADSLNAVFTTSVSLDAAPAPSTPAEQFVFAHAYETLLRINCQGVLSPGLARSWTQVENTDRWRVVLRPEARFWSGTRVTAGDVIASWRANGQRPVAALARHLADRATIVDDTTLDIRMGGIPVRALGSEDLAVSRRVVGSRSVEGSGRYRIGGESRQTGSVAGRSMLTLEPLAADLPRIVVYTTTASDARDLLDLGTDLLITDDRALSTYAQSRPIASVSMLDMASWTWLVVSRGAPGSYATSSAPGPVPEGRRDAYAMTAALAADVVRAHARPVGGGFWSLHNFRCDSMATPQPTRPPASLTNARVVYRRDEPVARAIAERLVALASAADHRVGFLAPGVARAGDRVTAAVALAPNEFDEALRMGRELAFVVALRRQPNLGCVEAQPLAHIAPWVTDQATTSVQGTVASLIETRPLGFVMTNRARFSLTDAGTLVVLPRAPEAATRR